MHPRFLLILIPLFVGALTGAPENAPPPPDFSNAFVQLAALGMPALDPNAKWSTSQDDQSSNYELRQLTESMKGNGWLLPSTDGKIRFLPMSALAVIETDPKSKPDSSGGVLKRSIGGGPSAARPPTPIKDPTKDATSLISAIKKLIAKNSENEYSRNNVSAELGDLLLFATQLHQTGHPQLANELAFATFELFPSRVAAVDAAINQIASADYQKAADEFFKSGDWTTYHQSLKKLLDRFPRGWTAREAIGIFLPQLEKQASGTKAPAPTLPSIPIAPQALAIVQEFTEKQPNTPDQPDAEEPGSASMSPEMMYRMQMMQMRYGGQYGGNSSMPSSLWLLDEASTTEEKKSCILRLAALKMAALPALAALATDPFLTHFPNSQSHSGYSGNYSSDDSTEDRVLGIYASLHRPATRGEIAKSLLSSTLPDPDNELNNADPETLRDLALSFWKEHQNDTREQLAAVFLREGSRSQSAQAAAMLATSKDPAAHLAFESHILASENALGEFQQLQIYLRSRRAAAKPFFAAYAKLVRSQNTNEPTEENGYDPSSYMIKEAGGMEKILKQLEALVGDQSPRSLAVQIAKGKPEDAEAAIRTLSTLLTDASDTKHLFTLLEGANAATDPTVRARFLMASHRINWRSKENNADGPPSDRAISEPEVKVWQKLIADTREIPDDLNPFSSDEKSTVSDLAAASLEYSVALHTFSEVHMAAAILDKPRAAIFGERAEARLSGKPLPPLPDASKISQQRLAEIVAETAKKLPTEIHPYLKTLSPDERAAWREWTQEPGEIAVPASVKDLRFLIIGRDENRPMSYANDITAAGIDSGFVITPASLKAQVEILARDLTKHSRTTIYLSNTGFGPGLEMTAVSVPMPAEKSEDVPNPANRRHSMQQNPQRIFYHTLECIDHTDETDGVILIQLSSNEHDTESHWKVTKGIPTNSDANKLESLNSALADLADSKDFGHLRITIQILSKTDAEIITKASSDDSDGDPLPNY